MAGFQKPKEGEPNKAPLSSKSKEEVKAAKQGQKTNIKIVIACVATSVAIVGGVAVYSAFKPSKAPVQVSTNSGGYEESESSDTSTPSGGNPVGSGEEVTSDSDRPWLSPDGVQPDKPQPSSLPLEGGAGIKDISGDTVKKNDTEVSKDTFVMDLNGNTVAEKFEVKGIHTVTDFVSYKKKRSVTGKGIELYWLEAIYKGQPAKIQVPFSIFKEMDPTGITVVDVEVVELDTGDGILHEVATNFIVRPDYKEKLQAGN
jgi:hypothetical protein